MRYRAVKIQHLKTSLKDVADKNIANNDEINLSDNL